MLSIGDSFVVSQTTFNWKPNQLIRFRGFRNRTVDQSVFTHQASLPLPLGVLTFDATEGGNK